MPKKNKDTFRQEALDYHKYPTPGKIAIRATTPLATQKDLALAYSPGVAAPCEEIEKDPVTSYDYTARGNLVAVISNGTAVLGLGDIGALASKPVMEGKAVLFKKFAGLDSIDIEVDEEDVDKIVDTIASLEPSFGGINLEDFKAPECFEIEEKLKSRMKIPVFHDDQHGTAIIVTAAFRNWIEYSGRDISKIKLVANGAGASSIACLNLLVEAGLKKENIIVCDRKGVIYKGRNEGMDPYKEKYAAKTKKRTLEEAMDGAHVFLGLSVGGAVSKKMVKSMGKDPLVMALANPAPEIMPEDVKAVRKDAIICTGRSDYTNQVNNVLCFPFIFRGALDVGATAINEEMKLACVEAIAALARKEVAPEVASVYRGEQMEFGPQYLIPKPFDPRLIVDLPIAVARAAMETGVATRPIKSFKDYAHGLKQFYIRSQVVMQPMMIRAKEDPKRIAYCAGEEHKVLQAIQSVLDEGLAKPIVIGRRKVVQARIKKLGLRMVPDKDFELVDPQNDRRYRDYWETYHRLMERRGVTPTMARNIVRTNTTVIGALMVHKGDADSMICGVMDRYQNHLKHVKDIIGLRPGVEHPAAMSGLIVSRGVYFFCDTQINPNPDASDVSEMTMLAVEELKRFAIKPKIALLSYSNFGSHNSEAAIKMRSAVAEIRRRDPSLEIDGEMKADAAFHPEILQDIMPNSSLKNQANLFIMPNLEAANVAFNMVKSFNDGIMIGPILLGAARPVHIVSPSITPRGILNITAVASVGAQVFAQELEDEDIQRGTVRHL